VGADVQFDTISANEWLVRNLAYSGGDFIFYARPADNDLSALLQCPQGAALFAIDRTTFSEQHPITAVTLTYAPGYRMISQV
jgi:GntR family transcriptional regulator, histidine utilization repressor